MQDITILHLSDFHIDKRNQGDIQIVLNALFSDIRKLKSEQDIHIDYVCFTGDLIQRGDLAKEQFSLAREKFIDPLLNLLQLDYTHFFLIPGNHDVDRTMIDKFMDLGLEQLLTSREEVNKFLDDELKEDHTRRLSAFYNFRNEMFGERGKSQGLAMTYIRDHSNARIGFACLDSAWRCAGDNDRNRLIVGERQIDNALSDISNCDLKIALLHHPISWLSDYDQRAVRDVLWKFDLVLTGHEHDLSEYEMIQGGQTTMYCACGALFDGRDTYNGYSIIRINPLTKNGDILLRQYYDSPRRVFDAALRLAEQGRRGFSLSRGNDSFNKVRRYTACLAENIGGFVNDTLMTRMLDETAPNGFENIYIPPDLRKTSEYIKEQMKNDDEKYSLEQILSRNKNIMFVGKREIGKTTMLQHIALKQVQNYSTGDSAPFLIDMAQLPPAGKRLIEKVMVEFTHNASANNFHFSIEELEVLLNEGQCLLLFDNIEISQDKQVSIIKEFVQKYPNNRFIFTVNESIFNALEVDDLPDFGCETDTWYLQTFDRHHIRALITKWFHGHEISVDDMVARTMAYLNRVGLPRTPLIVSMFLAIYKRDQDYVPTNESSVMERFMEIVLEKLAPSETRVGTFDYRSKEKFLSELAWFMLKEQKYPLHIDEFHKFTAHYFESKGLSLSRSKFDTLFFDKKVLVINNELVYFRYQSMFEYHVAVKTIKDSEALSHVLGDDKIFDSDGILGFITGLQRDRKDILVRVEGLLYPLIKERLDSLSTLDNYDLGLDFEVDVKKISTEFKESVMTETERDEALNVPDKYQNFENQIISLNTRELTDFQRLYILTAIYGRLLRNSDDLEKDTKLKAFRMFCLSLCIVWAELKNIVETLVSEKLIPIEEDNSDNHEYVSNLIKIVVPLVLQNLACETIGTPMLENIFKESIPTEINFVDFMVIGIYADSKMKDFISVIDEYIQRENSKDILRILSFKLMYYYHTGFVQGAQARSILKTLASCIAKMNGLGNKSHKRIIHVLENTTDQQALLKRYLS